jgi:L-arabinose isomerase
MRFSAQAAVAFDEIICKYDITAFGFYWWGERELVAQLRAQAGLAVSRLAALGRPGVTEGDVKSAMAMKILDLLGGGGMFVEFFSMDFDENFILMGHDGPSNVNMTCGRPRLTHLDVHHGKSGHGLGIDFDMQQGPVTLLNLTQFDAGDTFKLIYSAAEAIPGPILRIGNPNCRVRVSRPIHEFIDSWCQQGPSHHIALGAGDQSAAIETFGEAMGFRVVRV